LTGVSARGFVNGFPIIAMSPVVASGEVGSVGFEVEVQLTGVNATLQAGTPEALAEYDILGDSATGDVGTTVPEFLIPLTGVGAAGSVGSVIYVRQFGATLTGVTARGFAGNVNISPRVVALTGVGATGEVGTLGNTNWVIIDDTQTPFWQNVTTSSPAPGWSPPNTNPPGPGPGWTPI
jgi:hypothetical protein